MSEKLRVGILRSNRHGRTAVYRTFGKSPMV